MIICCAGLLNTKDNPDKIKVGDLVQEFGDEFGMTCSRETEAEFFLPLLWKIHRHRANVNYFTRLQTTKQNVDFTIFFPETCAPRESGLIDFRWNVSISVFQSCRGGPTVRCWVDSHWASVWEETCPSSVCCEQY